MPIIGSVNQTVKQRKIEWKIPDFFSLNFIGSDYDSPTIQFTDGFWQLRIRGIESSNCLSVFLKRINFVRAIACSLSIKKTDGTLFNTCTKNVWGNGLFRDFIDVPVLLQRESELLPSGTLTIISVLDLKIDEEQKKRHSEEDNRLKKRRANDNLEHTELSELDTLSTNLKDLFSNKESCDTTLQLQDQEYKAHRAILIARSAVFAAMFAHETSEKKTGIIVIPDCDPESFEKFLQFMYCGKLKNLSFSSAIHLYETSNKYEVQELKSFCLKYLMDNLTVENICDVVIFADRYDEKNLLNLVQCFFNKNLNKILQTSEWDCLATNNYNLSKRLLTDMSLKVKVPD